MEHFIYYPITPYHLILSSVIRKTNNAHYNSIILDEFCFDKSFINRVISNHLWDHVYVLKKSSQISYAINRTIFYKLKYDDLFNIKHANFVFFSFGNSFTNLLVNSIHHYNNILMGEDGLFPYYGLTVAKEYYKKLKYEYLIKKIQRFINLNINSKNQFNAQRIDKFLLLNPEWLPREVIEQYETEQIMLDQKAIHHVFDELTSLYGYKKESTFNDIDIIHFDENDSMIYAKNEREEFDLLSKIFRQLRGMKILIKLKPNNNDLINAKRKNLFDALQKETFCRFEIYHSGAKYPWEIVYYNSAKDFKDSAFMSSSFSTALISPKIFFGTENHIICLSHLLFKELARSNSSASILELIDRIRSTYLYKNIYMPKTYDELKVATLACS